MILRWSTLFWLALFAAAVGLLFQIAHAVEDLESRLRATQEQIHRDREAVHVLRAEWSYLNRPERIARLAERHLEMMPLTATNISRISALPPRPEDMGGRTFAEGPPPPPRRPAPELAGWRTRMPQPQARPAGAPDPIGDLVAATLQPAEPQPVPETLSTAVREASPAAPRNPVTGAPLPVRPRFVSETR